MSKATCFVKELNLKLVEETVGDAVAKSILLHLNAKKISLYELSRSCKIPVQRLQEYIHGERQMGAKIIGIIAKGLRLQVEDLTQSQASYDQRLSKFEYMDIFVRALSDFQRQASSLSQLTDSDYRHLQNCVVGLGGWKNVLQILERELFEAPRREKAFNVELNEILKEAKAGYTKRKSLRKSRHL